MPFDRGKPDDPAPSAWEQFESWCYSRSSLPLLKGPDWSKPETRQAFADWCFDQGYKAAITEELQPGWNTPE